MLVPTKPINNQVSHLKHTTSYS